MHGDQTTCLAIHDISCLGKCSLTAALPILSAAGVSAAALPTALLSNQTGGLNLYTRLDLTDQMRAIRDVWKRLDVSFDAAYSGYLASAGQAELTARIVSEFVRPGGLFVCDPAMADNGALYSGFDPCFVGAMATLCRRADVLTPNVTETSLLLGGDGRESFDEAMLDALKEKFELVCAVVTGVQRGDRVGCACLDGDGRVTYALTPRVEGMFHSTGDVFASVLTGCLLRGVPAGEACEKAADFTYRCVAATAARGADSRFGLCFEPFLPELASEGETNDG